MGAEVAREELAAHGDEARAEPPLWQRLLAISESHDVTFVWVPGHAGVEENERCDELAVAAAWGRDLATDVEYEASLRAGDDVPETAPLL